MFFRTHLQYLSAPVHQFTSAAFIIGKRSYLESNEIVRRAFHVFSYPENRRSSTRILHKQIDVKRSNQNQNQNKYDLYFLGLFTIFGAGNLALLTYSTINKKEKQPEEEKPK